MTHPRSGASGRRATVCLALLAFAGATSSPALADSVVPDMPAAALPDLAEATSAVLDEAGLAELAAQAAIDVSSPLPAVPAPTAAAKPVTAGAVSAPPPEPAPAAAASPSPGGNPTPDAPPLPAATQTAPTNVNVSVRVDSPGDNGAVEQANVAVQSVGNQAAETGPQYQADDAQYQGSIPSPASPTPDAVSGPVPAEPAVPADGWEWNWEWNCGDPAPEVPVPAGAGTQNWIWNWDWNCGDQNASAANTEDESGPQYQPGVTQYRPVNVNISVRINSPGSDGPVRQSNVAVVLVAEPLPQVRVELPAVPALPSAHAFASGSASSGNTAPLVYFAAVVDEFASAAPVTPFVEDECCEGADEPTSLAAGADDPQSVLLPQAPPRTHRNVTARERFRASVAVTVRLARASEAASRAARQAPKPARLRPASPRSAGPMRERASALSAAGYAPLSAPDGRTGYVALLVAAFAFAIAFADAARSVAAEVRAAGEDPDPPPDRPG